MEQMKPWEQFDEKVQPTVNCVFNHVARDYHKPEHVLLDSIAKDSFLLNDDQLCYTYLPCNEIVCPELQ